MNSYAKVINLEHLKIGGLGPKLTKKSNKALAQQMWYLGNSDSDTSYIKEKKLVRCLRTFNTKTESQLLKNTMEKRVPNFSL